MNYCALAQRNKRYMLDSAGGRSGGGGEAGRGSKHKRVALTTDRWPTHARIEREHAQMMNLVNSRIARRLISPTNWCREFGRHIAVQTIWLLLRCDQRQGDVCVTAAYSINSNYMEACAGVYAKYWRGRVKNWSSAETTEMMPKMQSLMV